MNDSTLKAMFVDSLETYLDSGKTAAQIAFDLRVPQPGDGQVESSLRIAMRNVIGATESEVAAKLGALVGADGTNGTLTKTGNLYLVS
jgi:hypothetical protein